MTSTTAPTTAMSRENSRMVATTRRARPAQLGD
jgi:hypothetical protein